MMTDHIENNVSAWIKERCEIGDWFISAAEAYSDYARICLERDLYCRSKKAFGQQLVNLGFKGSRTAAERRYYGIRLKKAAETV